MQYLLPEHGRLTIILARHDPYPLKQHRHTSILFNVVKSFDSSPPGDIPSEPGIVARRFLSSEAKIVSPTVIPIVPPRGRMSVNAAVLTAISLRGIAACNAMRGACKKQPTPTPATRTTRVCVAILAVSSSIIMRPWTTRSDKIRPHRGNTHISESHHEPAKPHHWSVLPRPRNNQTTEDRHER